MDDPSEVVGALNSPRASIQPVVFWASLISLLTLLVYGLLFQEHATRFLPQLSTWIGDHLSVVYIYSMAAFLLFCVVVMFSPAGKIKLGADDSKPEFARLSWYSMLFSAGMGTGLVFSGVAEPINHYIAPMSGTPRTVKAALDAMPLTYFHWGFSAWSSYVVMALAVAFFAFRKNEKISLRGCLRPLFGDAVDGWLGNIVDVSAVMGTLVGLAAALGLGAQQVSTGLARFGLIENDVGNQVILILVITAAATVSLLSGVDRGIRRLSELNLLTALLLATFVFLVGPTLSIVTDFFSNSVDYFSVLFERSLKFRGDSPTEDLWLRGWTFPYWAWWISWAPFVGIFIARISKGRTIRELIFVAIVAPTFFTFLWFEIFGGTALKLEVQGNASIADAVQADISTSIFVLLEALPLSALTSILAMIVITVFFVTSSDSASFVVDMLTSGGHPNPPKWQRVFWAAAEGACAATLLYVGGEASLKAMQSFVLAIAFPYCILMVLMMFSLGKALWLEHNNMDYSKTT